jgi:hypothetical protein
MYFVFDIIREFEVNWRSFQVEAMKVERMQVKDLQHCNNEFKVFF